MKTVNFIYPRIIKITTGGHRYEDSLQKILQDSQLDVRIIPVVNKQSLSIVDKLLAPFRSMRLLKNIEKNDVVVFNSTTGLYFLLLSRRLRRLGVKTLIIHHHYAYKEFRGLSKMFRRFVENSFLKSASYILTPSPYIRQLIMDEIQTESLLLPIPFKRPDLETLENKPVPGQLLYIGTIEKRKGLDLLMEALARIKNAEEYVVHIVGKTRDQNYKDELDKFIKANNLSVIYHGFLPDEELNRIISTSDLFVFPSLLEGFGMAINEVKFYGLPVVCFNNSAMPYSTTDGEDGYVVEDRNVGAFAEAIERIVKNRVLRDRMSLNAYKKAEKLYNKEDFENDSIEIFSNL